MASIEPTGPEDRDTIRHPSASNSSHSAETLPGDAEPSTRVEAGLSAHSKLALAVDRDRTELHQTVASRANDSARSPTLIRRGDDDDREDEPSIFGLFGDYELIEEVGRGAMGVVYKARQIELDRVVALKMILDGRHSSSTVIRRFKIEAETAGHLDHSCIVPVFQVGQLEGRHYYAMGFVEGQSLSRQVLAGPFAPAKAAEMVWLIAGAIQHAHSRGVIHRDLKPGNIMVDAEGRPKVTDFGLAKSLETDSGLTATGEVLGTPSYMSPEQASGRVHEVGPPADIYALGAILYCLLTGRPPFVGPTTLETLAQVIHDDPVPPRRLQPRLDRDLETICLKCLAKSPGHRYATAGDLAVDLRRFLDSEPIVARRPGPIYRLRKFSGRHRREVFAYGSAAMVAALLLLGTVALARRERSRRMEELIAEGRSRLLRASEAAPKVDPDPLFQSAMLSFGRAQELEPGSSLPLEGLIEVDLARSRRAIDDRDFGAARALLLPLRNLDRSGRYAGVIARLERKAIGTSRWKIASNPSGAEVTLAVLDADLRPGRPRKLGTTPLAEEDVAPGDYLLTFTSPGHGEARVPVLIARSETRVLEATLPRLDEVPPGMIYVPEGPFETGDPQSGTTRTVTVPGFFIDQTEVTGEAYERFLRANNWPPPDRWQGSTSCPPDLRQAPVTNVSWFDAYAYARWAGKRLPEDLEWEKAARGVDGRSYPWGNRFDPRRAISRESPVAESVLVGRHRDGASPYGCLDMAGGAWEWTSGRDKPGLADRIIRGGASSSTLEDLLTFRRRSAPPGGSAFGGFNMLGFRCARSLQADPMPELADALTTGPDLSAAAEYFFDEGKLDRVADCARRLLALNPRSVHGQFWNGVGLAQQKKPAEALAAFRVVWFQKLNYQIQLKTTWDEMQQLLKTLGDQGQAPDRSFLEAPDWFHHARHAIDAGRLDEGKALLEKVLKWDPENEVANEQMAMILDDQGQPDRAAAHRARRVEAYRRALLENPEEADLHDQFAEFLLHHNLEPALAAEHARKATKLVPGFARYRKVLAECLALASDWPGAVAEMTVAAGLDPEDEEVRDLLASYRSRLGKPAP